MTDENGQPQRRQGQLVLRKSPPICKRCPTSMITTLTEENERIYRLYLVAHKCDISEYMDLNMVYMFSLIAEEESKAQKHIMESSIVSALAKVF